MDSYPIHELERLTGIKAHTIRIWEKRFGLITPMRSDTNRRHYSEQQVRKLLNVSTLLSRGMRISRVASLTDQEINECILAGSSSDYTNTVNSGYVNDLVKSMLVFDEAGFEKIVASVFLRYGFFEGMMQVVYPFLIQAGLLWSASEAAPAQEHFASNIIRRKVLSAIDGLLPPEPHLPKYLMFLPEGEWHEIGLLLASYMARSRGCKVVYLGQNMAAAQVSEVAKVLKPNYVLTFFVRHRPGAEVAALVETLVTCAGDAKVLVAGSRQLAQAAGELPARASWLHDVNDLLHYLPD